MIYPNIQRLRCTYDFTDYSGDKYYNGDTWVYPERSVEIIIPKYVYSIRSTAFSCKITKISVDENNEKYCSIDGVLYTKNEPELVKYPSEKEMEVYTIPDSVTKIRENAFEYASKLREVIIPGGIQEIGEGAFYHSGLKKVTIQDGVEIIGDEAFSGCEKLNEITIPKSVMYLNYLPNDTMIYCYSNSHAYGYANYNDRQYTLLDGTKETGRSGYHSPDTWGLELEYKTTADGMYEYCLWNDTDETYVMICKYSGTEEIINIPGTIDGYPVRVIGSNAFDFGFSDIVKEIIIPGSIRDIQYNAFYFFDFVPKKVKIEEGVKYIDDDAFNVYSWCLPDGEVDIPESVIYIGENQFRPKRVEGYENNDRRIEWSKSGIKIKHINCVENSYGQQYANFYGIDCTLLPSTSKNIEDSEQLPADENIKNESVAEPKEIVLSKDSYTYNGKEQRPAVVVRDMDGAVISSEYYTVSYKNNKKVGEATVAVTLKGIYSGELRKTFYIVPMPTSIVKIKAESKGFRIQWKKKTAETTGYEIAYSTNKKFTKKTTNSTRIQKNKTVLKCITKLKANKKYYVRVRTYKNVKVNGKTKKVYSNWSKIKMVTTKK